MTKLFSVTLDDKPGQLAKLTGALADKGVNLRTASATTSAGKGVVNLITSDEAQTRTVLQSQRFAFAEHDALVAKIDDKPGSLAQLAKNLSAQNVNVKALALLSNKGPKLEVAVAVDNVEKAKTIIK